VATTVGAIAAGAAIDVGAQPVKANKINPMNCMLSEGFRILGMIDSINMK
jgi:hypothetical protein